MAISPSQRVALIKVISERLGNETWSLIDVTLNQFGIETPESWSGSTTEYVLRQIRNVPDQTLIDLAQHVGYKFEQPPPGVDPPFWRAGMLRLFVTHLATHRAITGELQEELLGISSFVAHNDIEPTLEWQVQIETALATCDALVALLHDGFHASNWTDQEIGFAMGRGVPTFAVRLGTTPYGFIGRFQAFNGNGKTAANLARELFDSYRKNKQTQRKMSGVLVGLFEASGSFATAKERIGYLEELETWDPSFAKRLRAAEQANSQISGSWGVSSRVEALAKKWEQTTV
ncbi:MAG TPA: TIR domain-containing protein [Terriglobales bacterium]|nr:TIR domain-containing protein [Terriglobales bacterium]